MPDIFNSEAFHLRSGENECRNMSTISWELKPRLNKVKNL